MPGRKSIYYGSKGIDYTPDTFVEEYNKHEFIDLAAEAMGISQTRLSVIAFRLRERGYPAKMFAQTPKHLRTRKKSDYRKRKEAKACLIQASGV